MEPIHHRIGDAAWRAANKDLAAEEAMSLAREELHAERHERRLVAETGGFTFTEGGIQYVVASDRDSLLRISGAALSAQGALMVGAPWHVVWACENNQLCPLDATGMVRMHTALVTHGLACHTRAQELKAEIDAAGTLDELAVIEVHVGWPAV